MELGFTVMRVFPPQPALARSPEGFCRRFDQLRSIAQKHKIRAIATIFDSYWNPLPKLGCLT